MILIQHSLKDNDGYTCLFERNKIYRKVLLQRHFTNSHEWRKSMRSPCANIQLRSNTEFPLTLASAVWWKNSRRADWASAFFFISSAFSSICLAAFSLVCRLTRDESKWTTWRRFGGCCSNTSVFFRWIIKWPSRMIWEKRNSEQWTLVHNNFDNFYKKTILNQNQNNSQW